MPEKRNKLIKALTNKGFTIVEDRKNRDHIWLCLINIETGEAYSHIRTKISMGRKYKVISDDTLSKMARQLHFKRNKEFSEYRECTYTYRQYLTTLKEEGWI